MKKIILVSLVILTLILAASPAVAAEPEKALIIYFDYSENINTEGLDIDAVSQASIAEPERYRDRSNVLVMADMLKERTGAEVYALHITEPYAPKFEDMVDGAQTDKNENRQFSFAEELPEWKDEGILAAMTELTERMGVKKSVVMWPVRIAAAGKAVTPGGAVEICRILGREETLRRLRIGLEKLA